MRACVSACMWPGRLGDPGSWRAQAFYLQQQASAALGATADQLPGLKLPYYPNLSQNSGESEETKRCGRAPCLALQSLTQVQSVSERSVLRGKSTGARTHRCKLSV